MRHAATKVAAARPVSADGLHAAWRAGLAALAAVTGALTVVAELTSHAPWHGALALNPSGGPAFCFTHLLSLAAGIGLLLLARGLAQGKRRAADLALGVLAVVATVRVARDADAPGTAMVLILGALVVATRGWFKRGGARPPVLAATVALLAAGGAYTVATIAALSGQRGVGLSSVLAADAAGRVAPSALAPSAPLGLGLDVLALVALCASAIFLRALLRPAPAADGHLTTDHVRAAALVTEHGDDSLAPFALREDKAYFFAHGGVLAYRTLRETAVVSGDPVGPPGSAEPILRDFTAFAVQRGWDVVVTAASERHIEAYARLGMRMIHIGNEAVVDPRTFSLEGRAIRKVRQSVHRVSRRGWTVTVARDGELDLPTMAELEAVERAWRAGRSRLQGFAMTLGRLWGDGGDVGGIYVLARDPGGRLTAFLRFVEYGEAGLSLDAMRRLGDEPNGLNEAMVVAALEHARTCRKREVSLNFAGFAHLMAAEAALSRRQRALRAVLHLAHGRFQLERLVRFNDKFFPHWRPRYLVYGRRTHLPLAALRVLQAEAYIRPPRSRPLSARWRALPMPARVPTTPARSGATP